MPKNTRCDDPIINGGNRITREIGDRQRCVFRRQTLFFYYGFVLFFMPRVCVRVEFSKATAGPADNATIDWTK